jgi:hypothetical protein
MMAPTPPRPHKYPPLLVIRNKQSSISGNTLVVLLIVSLSNHIVDVCIVTSSAIQLRNKKLYPTTPTAFAATPRGSIITMISHRDFCCS